MRFLQSPRWRTFLFVWVVFLLSGGGLLYRNWTAVEWYVDREYRRSLHTQNIDPVCRDLAAGRFPAGSPVEELIAAYPPEYITQIGRFTDVRYKSGQVTGGLSSGAIVIAIDGRLVRANIGTFDAYGATELFNTMTPADETALLNGHIAHGRQRRDAWMAVVGAAIMPWQ